MTATRHLQAIATMLGAVAAFAGMDALLKLFSQHYPPLEVAALRGLGAMPFMLVPVLISGRYRDLRPRRFGMHLLRAALMLFILYSFVYAVRVLSLADAYSIFLVAPLIVTALSVLVFGEHIEWRRWLAISVGLIGVLTMLRPCASSLLTLGAVAAFAAAIAYAGSAIALRVVAQAETTVSVVFWMVALMTVLSSLAAAPDWVPIERAHWGLIAAIGLFATIGQHLMTEAFRSVPPSVVAPFEYTALPWGMGIDWIFWGVTPGSRVFVGGGIVIASGLYLAWREHRFGGAHLGPASGEETIAHP